MHLQIQILNIITRSHYCFAFVACNGSMKGISKYSEYLRASLHIGIFSVCWHRNQENIPCKCQESLFNFNWFDKEYVAQTKHHHHPLQGCVSTLTSMHWLLGVIIFRYIHRVLGYPELFFICCWVRVRMWTVVKNKVDTREFWVFIQTLNLLAISCTWCIC